MSNSSANRFAESMWRDPTAATRPESVNVRSAAKAWEIPPVPISPQPNGSVIGCPRITGLFEQRRPLIANRDAVLQDLVLLDRVCVAAMRCPNRVDAGREIFEIPRETKEVHGRLIDLVARRIDVDGRFVPGVAHNHPEISLGRSQSHRVPVDEHMAL